MNETHILLQPAYILQQRKYRETSLIVEVFTRDFGRLSILAKGVRKPKSKTAGLFRPFTPILLSYIGRAELKILTHIESASVTELNGLALYSGFYVNELIGRFLHKFDPHPEVFTLYQQCISELADTASIEPVLRMFELQLLKFIGYAPQLSYDFQLNLPVQAGKRYLFDIENGPYEAEPGDFQGSALLALETGIFLDQQTLSGAKKIMRSIIDFHLQGKPLQSRAVISRLLKR